VEGGRAAAEAEVDGGGLTLRVPVEWLGSPSDVRYGVLASNAGANLADYVPALGQPAAGGTR